MEQNNCRDSRDHNSLWNGHERAHVYTSCRDRRRWRSPGCPRRSKACWRPGGGRRSSGCWTTKVADPGTKEMINHFLLRYLCLISLVAHRPPACSLQPVALGPPASLPLQLLPVISRRAPAFRCARVVRCAGRVGRPVRGRAIVSPARAPSRCFPRHRAAFGPPLKTRRGRTMPWLVGTALPGFDGAELAKDGKSGPVGETVILLTPPLLPY